MTDIAVTNHSGISDLEVARWTHAVARQVQQDFLPYWGGFCGDSWVRFGNPEGADWEIRIVDDSTVAGAAGWHSLEGDDPHGEVSINSGFNPATVLSHEVLEMLANPSVANLTVNWRDGLLYPMEVCDPVQAVSYDIDGVAVSDFVLPAWFGQRQDASTAFSTDGLKPFELARGGYAVRYDQQFRDRSVFNSEPNPDHLRTVLLQEACR